tara:strand:- start:1262 stop:1531 length:270 start_codon:yes stop_codon:yes gene_type:complete
MKFNRADEIKIKEMANKYSLDAEVVRKIISAPYDFMQKKTKELDFVDDLTREEFDKMKKNFNIPGLGKIYASYFLYNEIQKKKKKKLGS